VAETLGALLVEDTGEGGRRGVERAPRAVRLARAFLHDAVAEKITLDELAIHAGLDKFHLVRAFRAEVGLPPYEYLTHVRVSRAKELLARGARVVDVAQAVGFCDQSQLHRHFRRIVGITPGSFSGSFGGRSRKGGTRRQDCPSLLRAVAAHSPHGTTRPNPH
jgi:AraC-like DNA-binding protein